MASATLVNDILSATPNEEQRSDAAKGAHGGEVADQGAELGRASDPESMPITPDFFTSAPRKRKGLRR